MERATPSDALAAALAAAQLPKLIGAARAGASLQEREAWQGSDGKRGQDKTI